MFCVVTVFGMPVFCPTLCCHTARNAPTKATRKVSLKERLGSYGSAGIVSYGLLNTLYYVSAFLFFWTQVAKVPRGWPLLFMSSALLTA